MENCEAMTSSPHSFAYSYRLVKKCFLKICETSKCHNFLIFQLIFIRFSLLCLKIFTLSSEIELNLLWSSSLIRMTSYTGLIRAISLFNLLIGSFTFKTSTNIYTSFLWHCKDILYLTKYILPKLKGKRF